jgi:signal transduction histidine kinase
VRRRLVIAIASVATASVVLFAVPLGVVVGENHRDRELLRLQRDTVAATRAVDIGSRASDPVELPRSRDRLAAYDAGARRVSGRGPARGDRVVAEAIRTGRPAAGSEDGTLVAAAPVVAGERVVGALRAARSDEAAAGATRDARLALLALAIGVIAAATLAAALLARRLARPLEELSVAARRLGDGEFTVRSPRSSIAEADAIGAALDATALRLGDLVARERAFSADASHQLRTPLAALRLELEAMELRGDDSPELRGALGEVDRLQSTVDTLLALSRDGPRGQGVTDLTQLLGDALPPHRAALAERARPLHSSPPAGLPAADAHPGVVREILDVLLTNATEHGHGAVTVEASHAGQWLHVLVSDEGPGIPEGPEDELFARGSGTGHGIGLSLARSLAHAEGGSLKLTGRTPGATFSLTLRAREAADAG